MELPVIALGWLLGLTGAGLWSAPAWMPMVWVAALTPVAGGRLGRRWALVVAVAAVAALLGGLRLSGWEERAAPPVAGLTGQEVTVEGVVRGAPQPGRTTTAFEVEVDRVLAGGTWVDSGGKVRVTLSQYARYLPGTRLALRGELEAPARLPEFDYPGYLARRGVYATMFYPEADVLREAPQYGWEKMVVQGRLALEDALGRALPEPEASLGAGIVFGRDGQLDREVYDDFRTTGLAHIVAVSGSNVALVTGMVFFLLSPRIGRRKALWPAIGLVGVYVVLAGAEASIMRGGLMAGIFLFGSYLGRQQSGLAALSGAFIGMTALSPGAALDVGFQLSFAATAGLITFAPWLRAGLRGVMRGPLAAVPESVVLVTSLSLAATVSTLPLVWHHFEQVSLIGPVANILVEPVFAVAFMLAGLTAVLGNVHPLLGWEAGLLAYYPLAFITWVAEVFARMPMAAADLPPVRAEVAAGLYVLMAVPGWFGYRYLAPVGQPLAPGAGALLVRRVAIGGSLAGLAVVVGWHSLLPLRAPGELRVEVLDVGQGDAVLVTTPGGARFLIDSGPSGIVLARELGAVLPHWSRRVDYLLLTHADQDHIGGAPVLLGRYGVGEVMDGGSTSRSEAFVLVVEAAGERRRLAAGESFEIDGVLFEVLWPGGGGAGASNDQSVVLRVTYGGVRVLLAGDIEAGVQRTLLAGGEMGADVLLVPHHGSKTSDGGFLRAVGASSAIISVGAGNRYGHPASETLAALEGAAIYRTDVHGRVTVSSNGEGYAVRTERR